MANAGKLIVAWVACLVLAGCTATQNPPTSTGQYGGGSSVQAGQAEVLGAQQQQLRDREVTITAQVKRVLPDDLKGAKHQRFLIALENGSTVLIAHNIDLAPHVPVTAGDTVTIHGVYIWNEKGGVIHWTHHSDGGHEGGFIEFNGQRYQ